MTTLRHLAILLPLALLLFGLNLGAYDIAAPDEPRFAQAAREMLRSGDYLVPRVNGETYLEKPPLLFWAMLPFSAVAGDVTATTARIPSLLAGLLTVLFTYLLARRMYGARIALWAGIILITCTRVWWQARFGQIDMLLTATMTVSIYALWRYDDDRRPGWLFLLYGGMALGLLAKGPPALLFPLLTIAAYYWRNPWGRRATHWVLGTLAALGLFLLWYIPARLLGAEDATEAVQAGMWENIVRNTVGRIFLGVSKAQWPWYYLTTVPVDLVPWAVFLPFSLVWFWRRRKADQPTRFLWCWIVPAFVVFSLIVGKRAIYILPLFPAFAILLAASLDDLMHGPHPLWRRNAGLAWAGALALLGALLALASILPLGDVLPVTPTTALVVYAVAIALAGVLMLWRTWQSDGAAVTRWIAATMTLVLAGFALAAPPVLNQAKSAAAFCAPIRALDRAGENFQLYSVGFSREAYIYHADHFHEEVFTDLLEVPELAGEDFLTVAQFQIRARKLIADAVEEVPLARLDGVTDSERQALRTAIEVAIREEAEEESLPLRAFEEVLIAEVQAFQDRFTGAEPAFLFVQQEDWRWILPFWRATPPVYLLREDGVGSRNVLLLANETGRRMAESQGFFPVPEGPQPLNHE